MEDHQGKIMSVNDGDADGDGIPDFADGYSLPDAPPDGASLMGVSFIPYILDLSGVKFFEDTRVGVLYNASSPNGVTRSGSGTASDPYVYTPAANTLRLWTKNAHERIAPPNTNIVPGNRIRSSAVQPPPPEPPPPGYFVQPFVQYTIEDFRAAGAEEIPEAGSGVFRLWIEAVRPVAGPFAPMISFLADPDGPQGGAGFMLADAVRVTPYKMGDFNASDANHPENTTANSPANPPRLYVGTATNSVSVKLDLPTTPPLTPPPSEIVWVKGELPAAANSLAASSIVTLTPADGTGNVVPLHAGRDENGNGILELAEATQFIEVMVIQLDSITVTDRNDPNRTATNPTATELYVAEPTSGAMLGRVDIEIDAAGSPDTLEGGAYVKWKVDGAGIEGASAGDFYQGNPSVRLRPDASGNRDYAVNVGFDQNLDGEIDDPGEICFAILVHVVKAGVEVALPVVELLDENTLTALTFQGTGTAVPTNYKYEIRFASSSDWYQLDSSTAATWTGKARVAGRFKVRVTTSIAGTVAVSEEQDVEAQFPSAATIKAHPTVRTAMDAEWATTKAETTPTMRRERGFWIQLDMAAQDYVIGTTFVGPWVDNATGASVIPPPKPADSHATPTPLDQPTYTVAIFHTHTPTTYRTPADMAPTGRRGVGLSAPDIAFAFDISFGSTSGAPIFAYDYLEDAPGSASIPAGHALHAPAEIYDAGGPVRRPTP